MKSAKPPPSDAAAHRRSQPARQARTNPPRSSNNVSRSVAGRDEPVGNQPIDIFPAITFFADTLTALPKELVRHFTLLREVDAKICGPEEQLFELASAALESNQEPGVASHTFSNAISNSSVQAHPQQAAVDTAMSDPGASLAATSENNQGVSSQEQLLYQRRQLFRQISFKIQEMIVSLEEKNHVIGTANEALQRQITRIEDVWPHLENEFTDEAKWGSTTHWAYPDNRTGKATHPERARRDGAAAISAAAQALAEEAAARSDARKQAVQAKKSLKNNHQDSDLDDGDHRAHKGEGTKKAGQGKVRKTAEANTGLGISTAANGNPPTKKRKVETAANGGAQGERANNVTNSANASKSKTGVTGETAASDGPKKRKALPSGGGQSKKKYEYPIEDLVADLQCANKFAAGMVCRHLSHRRLCCRHCPSRKELHEHHQHQITTRAQLHLEPAETRYKALLIAPKYDRRHHQRRPKRTGSKPLTASLVPSLPLLDWVVTLDLLRSLASLSRASRRTTPSSQMLRLPCPRSRTGRKARQSNNTSAARANPSLQVVRCQLPSPPRAGEPVNLRHPH